MKSLFLSLLLFIFGNSTCFSSTYELSIAAIFRDEGPYLKEWIEYHKMVGVEHFWMYNDSSRDNWEEVLKPYIEEGLVEIINWPIPTPLDFIHYQRMAYRDALGRSSGITTWLALIDIDEFLLPKEEKTVTECLSKHFSHASGVYINWNVFGTGKVYLEEDEPILFKLTACAERWHPRNAVGKSIVKPDRVQYSDVNDIWNIHHYTLLGEDQYLNGDGEPIRHKEIYLDNVDYYVHDLIIDRFVCDRFIRINHYTMRDENFFHEIRLPRNKSFGIEERDIWQHYHEFNKEHDNTIKHFIRTNYPEICETFWKQAPLSGEP
ncbi:MAG: glycosyltransferase family 92 protein [Chlamydiales bacterium]|nr:glycosyltransferase family 92 protein [Chlamydiales bacterium]